jgi:hypothetical protein
VVFDHQLQRDVVQSGPMIPAIAMGDVYDLYVRPPVAGVAAIDVKARPVEMDNGRCQPEALGCGSGHETVEFRHPIGIERIQRASRRIIIEVLPRDGRGHELRRRRILEDVWYEIHLITLNHTEYNQALQGGNCDIT